jgi:hypothetical protein
MVPFTNHMVVDVMYEVVLDGKFDISEHAFGLCEPCPHFPVTTLPAVATRVSAQFLFSLVYFSTHPIMWQALYWAMQRTSNEYSTEWGAYESTYDTFSACLRAFMGQSPDIYDLLEQVILNGALLHQHAALV